MLKIFKNKYFWIIFAVILVSMLIMRLSSFNRSEITGVEKLVRGIYTPLQNGVSSFRDGMGGWSVVFSEKKTLNQTIAELEKENQELRLENQALRQYKNEAERLRDILNFKDTNIETYDLIAARVIARSPTNWYKHIVIDKGAADGIEKDMPVISPDGLVGRVSSISTNSAYVSLVTDREVAVGAVLEKTRETNGVVEGLGDSNTLRMINVPYYSTIEKGNRVITSGLSQMYPPGIHIGTVQNVTREPNGLLLSAAIAPAVNFDKLEEVLVITDYRPIKEENNGEEE